MTRRRRSRLSQVVLSLPHTALLSSGLHRSTRRPLLLLVPRSRDWF